MQLDLDGRPDLVFASRVGEFALPDDSRLAGKTLDVQIRLPIVYPGQIGATTFEDKRTTLIRKTKAQIASREVKQAYWSSWTAALWIGLGGSAAGGSLLILLAHLPNQVGFRQPPQNDALVMPTRPVDDMHYA